MPEAPWVGDYYDKYRNRYYGLIGDDEMSLLWAYEPDKCDGHYCPHDCDNCPIAEEDEEEDADFLKRWESTDWSQCIVKAEVKDGNV